jgi:RES domain-containing protein
MLLWRISNHTTLDGRAGLFASARWHTQGHPILHLAETPTGALTEVLINLELDPSSLPTSYKLLKAEAPDDISIRSVAEAGLPENWREDQVVTRTIGDEWLASGDTALLRVPSVIMPETFNILLNPQHADAARVNVLWHREYPWDQRLFESGTRKPRKIYSAR